MTDREDYSVTFLVNNTPEEVFAAINNVRGWWSQEIEGDTDRPGRFKYRYQDVHRATFEITEFVPGQKVVWHVLDNYFNFVKDKTEWTGTDVIFEINKKGDKTELHFTHAGLVPAYECYTVCSNAWGSYISGSLRDLITKGKGQPNPIEEVVNQAREMSNQYYTASFTVDQSPEEVFAAINNVRGWWSENIEGETDRLGAEFVFHAEDLHHSTQRITEFVPGQKVLWHVLESRINFVSDRTEWKNTDIIFEISRKGDKTELNFTHAGLAPALECYGSCSDAWGFYIKQSLFALITTGQGEPDRKETLAETQAV
ncbi:MAG TPA: SRPBCC domain-containing protein [Chloroflexia bacterium]|nr:SRPBCC domain-containing protein [Chloroflexia bacterium]